MTNWQPIETAPKNKTKDKWLQNMYQKMKEATDKNELNKFLDENPDYFQIIMYLASQVEIID